MNHLRLITVCKLYRDRCFKQLVFRFGKLFAVSSSSSSPGGRVRGFLPQPIRFKKILKKNKNAELVPKSEVIYIKRKLFPLSLKVEWRTWKRDDIYLLFWTMMNASNSAIVINQIIICGILLSSLYLKGLVDFISSDSSFVEWHAWFTTVHWKALSDQECMRYL